MIHSNYKKLLILFQNSNFKQLSYMNNDETINLKKDFSDDSFDEIACTKACFVPYFVRSKYVCCIKTYNENTFQHYVQLNQYVKKGDLLGVLLYLNLTIDLVSPVFGIVSEIRVKNNEMVGYGQVMFVILQSKES